MKIHQLQLAAVSIVVRVFLVFSLIKGFEIKLRVGGMGDFTDEFRTTDPG